MIADRLVENVRALAQLPRILRQWVDLHPMPGAAPPQLALPEPQRRGWSAIWLVIAAAAGAAAMHMLG